VIGTLGLIENKKRAKTLIVDSLDNANLILSSRNVEKTKVTNSFGLNIYDLLYHEKLVISKTAIEELNQLLDPKTENGKVEVDTTPKAKKEAKPKAEKAEATETEEAKPKKEAKPKAEKAAEKPAADKATPKKPKAVKKEAKDDE